MEAKKCQHLETLGSQAELVPGKSSGRLLFQGQRSGMPTVRLFVLSGS